MNRKTKIVLLVFVIFFIFFLVIIKGGKKGGVVEELVFMSPSFLFQSEPFSYEEPTFKALDYDLPLKFFPENYESDIVGKLNKNLSEKQKKLLLSNGSLIVEGDGFDDFNSAYNYLTKNEIPTLLTSDYILHLLNAELIAVKNNIEIEKIKPALEKFLVALIQETERQYKVQFEKKGKNAELAKRNLAYLSTALELLNPNYSPIDDVKKDVDSEVSKINNASGVMLSGIFSKGCPSFCKNIIADKDDNCLLINSEEIINVEGKNIKTIDFYKNYCLSKCYCEDYSNYKPSGTYTLNNDLKNYFLATTYLKRMTFSLNNEEAIRQGVLLTLAVNNIKIFYEGKEIEGKDLYRRIYSTIAFFDGASENLNLYDWAQAINEIMKEKKISSPSEINISDIGLNQFKRVMGVIKGEGIFKDIEIGLLNEIKEPYVGLSLMPKNILLDSYIFQKLNYKNVGPNPDSKSFREVRGYMKFWEKFNCADMENDKFQKGWDKKQYWHEISKASFEVYKERPEEFYSVSKVMPTNIEVMKILGSLKAEEILKKFYQFESFCEYPSKSDETKKEISSFLQDKWQESLPNLFFWLSKSMIREKQEVPIWAKSDVYKTKELLSALSFISQTKFPLISFYKEGYGYYQEEEPKEISLRSFSYIEPDLELYRKMEHLIKILTKGLQNQDFMTGKSYLALDRTLETIKKIGDLSEKEIKNEPLTDNDIAFVKELPFEFKDLISGLLSVYLGEGQTKNFYLFVDFPRDIYKEEYSQKVLKSGGGKLDWLIILDYSTGKMKAVVGPVFSYYEFAFPAFSYLSDTDWREKVLKETPRPIFYSLLEINSSLSPYIIK